MTSAPGLRLVKSAPESSSMPPVTTAVPMSTLRSGARRSSKALANGTITTVRLCKKPAVEAEVRLDPRHMHVSSTAMMSADDGGTDDEVAVDAEGALVEKQHADDEGYGAAQRDDARGVHAVHADLHQGV